MRSIFGWFFVVVGITAYGAEIDNLRKGRTDQTVMGLTLATLFTLGGRALIRSAQRAKLPAELQQKLAVAALPAMASRDIERIVLTCAKKHGGRVTIAEVAADGPLSFTEAKAKLEELAHAGACTVDVTEQGAFIYEFGGLIPRQSMRAELDG